MRRPLLGSGDAALQAAAPDEMVVLESRRRRQGAAGRRAAGRPAGRRAVLRGGEPVHDHCEATARWQQAQAAQTEPWSLTSCRVHGLVRQAADRAVGVIDAVEAAAAASQSCPSMGTEMHSAPSGLAATCSAPNSDHTRHRVHPYYQPRHTATPGAAHRPMSDPAALKAQLKRLGDQRSAVEVDIAVRSARRQAAGMGAPLVDAHMQRRRQCRHQGATAAQSKHARRNSGSGSAAHSSSSPRRRPG